MRLPEPAQNRSKWAMFPSWDSEMRQHDRPRPATDRPRCDDVHVPATRLSYHDGHLPRIARKRRLPALITHQPTLPRLLVCGPIPLQMESKGKKATTSTQGACSCSPQQARPCFPGWIECAYAPNRETLRIPGRPRAGTRDPGHHGPRLQQFRDDVFGDVVDGVRAFVVRPHRASSLPRRPITWCPPQ